MANMAGRVLEAVQTSAQKIGVGSGGNRAFRSSSNGELWDIPVMTAAQAQAYEGSRFTALHAPAVGGSGVVLGSYPTVFSDTLKIAVCVVNKESAGGKSYILDYIRGRVIVADTNGTSVMATAEIDSTNRYSSGGTALAVANANPGASAPVSAALVYVGDVTAAAAGTYRTHIGQAVVKVKSAPCLYANEQYLFSFGQMGGGIPNGVAGTLIASASTQNVPFGPAVIPPGGSLLFKLAIVAGDTTPAQFDWDLGWSER